MDCSDCPAAWYLTWHPGEKIPVEGQSGAMAFFGMKLGGENIVARDCRRERDSVVGGRNSGELIGRFTEITMHEIESFVITNILP